LGFYLLAAGHDASLARFGDVVGAEMWYPASRQKRLPVRAFDPELLDAVTDALRLAAAGIKDESWPVQPGPDCDRCGVRLVCPAWPDGRESFAP
jgi:hypothetical protein